MSADIVRNTLLLTKEALEKGLEIEAAYKASYANISHCGSRRAQVEENKLM